jgi:hypothetical protein
MRVEKAAQNIPSSDDDFGPPGFTPGFTPGSDSPDDNDASPSPNKGGRPSKYIPTGPIIDRLTIPNRYYRRGYLRNDDGTADETRKVILCFERKKVAGRSGEEYRDIATPIWDGNADVLKRVQAWSITPSRRLKAPEWQEYVIATAVSNQPNAHPSRALLASMDLVQRKERALWTEQLGVTLSGQTFRLAEFLSFLALALNRTLMLRAQGPVYLDDGSPDGGELLNSDLVFATRSRVFDTNGEKRAIETDLDHLPDKADYYDLTPPDEIDDGEIRKGLELFRDSFEECVPKYAAIPAAFIGQLFSGWLAAIRIDFWSAIHLTGEKGSGKSYYCLRFDSIQARNSPKSRGTLTDLKPVLNLGDTTSSPKGPKYAVVNYGGFTITVDDALKKGATETEIRIQSDKVSNLIRSNEAGGGDLAKVDRNRNEVVAAESKALHSSIRIPSEIPITGQSTLDRLIYLPHLTDAWNKGKTFNREIADRLSTGHSREMMHRAYSAFVAYGFQRIPTDAQECLEKAKAETETWGVSARTSDRYAAVLSGIFLLERFAAEYDVDMATQVAKAILALKECARTQAGSNIPVARQWARELRRARSNHKVAFPGPPAGLDNKCTNPSVTKPVRDNPDGTQATVTVWPWEGARLEDFGMESAGIVHNRADIYGYTIPPKEMRITGDKIGRPNANPLDAKWLVVLTNERFEDLCKTLTREYAYEPATVMNSLIELGLGGKMQILIDNVTSSKRPRLWVFDAELLRTVDDENED